MMVSSNQERMIILSCSNTLKTPFVAIYKVLLAEKEMYSKRCYKLVSQCSAILGELEYIRNYEEFGIIFAKILDVI